ncbi:hypothetical protein CH337_17145 [Rhodoblastus acidophilus]|nr:hypothetical protein CKO16_10680 [Rhodoblastus acidophilus]RAI17253.1 hypothetical protein CH337_17145 [Rhodoblastus acidophilus]
MGGKHNTVKTRASLIREEKALSALEAALKGAKSRAREKKRPFDLTLNWARVELEAQCYKCAVSGIPFYFTKGEQRDRRNPFAPSIDRIDCAGGYTKDNCRIVIYAVNVMLSDWGDDVFYRIVEQVSQNKSGSFAPHLPPQGAALNKNN